MSYLDGMIVKLFILRSGSLDLNMTTSSANSTIENPGGRRVWSSDPRTWELAAPTTLSCGSTHNQARRVGVSLLPRFEFTLSSVEPRSKIMFLSTSCQSGAKPQRVHSYRRKGERIIMLAINKWWHYCLYRCYF